MIIWSWMIEKLTKIRRSLFERLESLLLSLTFKRKYIRFTLLSWFLQPLSRLLQLLPLVHAQVFLSLHRSVINQLLFFRILQLHLLLVFQDLLGCELEDIGLRQTILADGPEEVLIGVEDAWILKHIDWVRKWVLLCCAYCRSFYLLASSSAIFSLYFSFYLSFLPPFFFYYFLLLIFIFINPAQPNQ